MHVVIRPTVRRPVGVLQRDSGLGVLGLRLLGPNELQLDLAAILALILSSVTRVTRPWQDPLRLVRRRGPGPGRTFQLSEGDSENHQAAARPRPLGCRPQGPRHCDSVSASKVARTRLLRPSRSLVRTELYSLNTVKFN